jgi:hypothetical protein
MSSSLRKSTKPKTLKILTSLYNKSPKLFENVVIKLTKKELENKIAKIQKNHNHYYVMALKMHISKNGTSHARDFYIKQAGNAATRIANIQNKINAL